MDILDDSRLDFIKYQTASLDWFNPTYEWDQDDEHSKEYEDSCQVFENQFENFKQYLYLK